MNLLYSDENLLVNFTTQSIYSALAINHCSFYPEIFVSALQLARNHWIYLDRRLIWKISKPHFFQGIKNSFHWIANIGPEPHQNFFQIFFSTNLVARGAQSFGILEGATDLLIEQWSKFSCQFNPDMWWTNAENFKPISSLVSDLLLFNWKILAIVGLRLAENGKLCQTYQLRSIRYFTIFLKRLKFLRLDNNWLHYDYKQGGH